MDTNNVISLKEASDLAGSEYKCVKLTSTGVAVATSSDGAIMVGTLLRAAPHQEDGVYAGKACAVHRRYSGVHFAQIGVSSAAVAAGATLALDAATDGALVPSASNVVAVSCDAFTAALGAIVRVIFV